MVKASNNSIEDVHLEAFWDGIEIGDTLSDVSNVLVSNVQAATSQNRFKQNLPGGMTNAVHLCGPNNGSFGACQNHARLTDVTILQAANQSNPAPLNSVQDDVTGAAGTVQQ
jgi:hypothetical protein